MSRAIRRPHDANSRLRAHIVKLIVQHVSYFNGWHVDDAQMNLDCLDATYEVLAYLKRKKLLRPIK